MAARKNLRTCATSVTSAGSLAGEDFGWRAATAVKIKLRMPPSAPTSSLRQLWEERFSQLLSEVETLCDAQAAEAVDRARRHAAGELNQAVRQLRRAADLEDLGMTLADVAGAFASHVALFRVEGEMARGVRARGVPEEIAERFGALEVPLCDAAALAGLVDDGEPVVAAATASEVSPALADLLEHQPNARVSLFPVAPRGRVAALLYAWGAVEGPPLELLAEAAAAVWNGFAPAAPSGLVTIAPREGSAAAWDLLSAEQRRIHLSAQRAARVRVSQMRLYQAADVQAGRAHGDLYGALRKPIDDARAAFRENYFERCPNMVDYLHLELVRTLAHDDPELLGKDYPGPLA
jgi:DNA gyrase/topoisomerase IV subunit B